MDTGRRVDEEWGPERSKRNEDNSVKDIWPLKEPISKAEKTGGIVTLYE
jgi:hypothetical protein